VKRFAVRKVTSNVLKLYRVLLVRLFVLFWEVVVPECDTDWKKQKKVTGVVGKRLKGNRLLAFIGILTRYNKIS